MGLLDDQIAGDALQAFMDTDGFAETIQYIPNPLNPANATNGNVTRSIAAVVRRMTPEPQMGTRGDVQPKLLVIVANDPVLGIASDQVDYGGDKLYFPYRLGESPSTHPLKQAKASETNDPGCLTLEV